METIFLGCFAFGALFTLVSVVLGVGGHGAAHIGHGGGHIGHPHVGHPHAESGDRFGSLPLLSVSSLVGALTWFGAAWYLIARFLGLVLSGEREMDPADYRLEGTVGQVTVSIPAGGTGEVVFSKAGSRRSEAARAINGGPIPRGSEVVITTYVDGFATVQPWGEFMAAREKL